MFILDIIFSVIYYVLYFYSLCLLAMGVVNLIGANPKNPFVSLLDSITSPTCKILSKRFPRLIMENGNYRVDLSPLALMLIIGIILVVLQKLSYYIGFSI